MDTQSLEAKKNVRMFFLKRNVKMHLRRHHDWKVAKAMTTGEPLSENDVRFRKNVVDRFNQRLAKLESAQTEEEVRVVGVEF